MTVTHFSEKRGTMEKISVPSTNIFNAEFKTDKSKSNESTFTGKSSTNPFLNMSPATQTVTVNVTSTNPFHVTASPTSTTTNCSFNNTKSVQSGGNNLPDATEAALDAIILLAATNPFSTNITHDECDKRHIELNKTDINNKELNKNHSINNINNNNNDNDRNNSSNKKLNETYTKNNKEVINHFILCNYYLSCLFF